MKPKADLLERAYAGDPSSIPELLELVTFAACEIMRLQDAAARRAVTAQDQVFADMVRRNLQRVGRRGTLAWSDIIRP